MHVDNFDALRIWLIRIFSQISEAEPTALSKYVCILMKKDVKGKGKDPKIYIAEQLEVFLQEETSGFIEKLFKALESKEYMSEDILAEINERREKKDKKKTKIPKPDKIEKLESKAIDKNRRPSRQNVTDGLTGTASSGSGTASNNSDTDRHQPSVSNQRYPPPSAQTRVRTPSPAPRRHRLRSRSRSPVHRRRRDSRDGYDRGNYSTQSERNQTFSNISSTNCNMPRVGSYEGESSQSNSILNQQQHQHAASQKQILSNITPVSQSQRNLTPILPHQGANITNITSGYTPSSVAPVTNKRSRCRDFDEKGYCMRGDLCPFDHGSDPVVVENVNFGKVVQNYQGSMAQTAATKKDETTENNVSEPSLEVKRDSVEPISPIEEVRAMLSTDRGRQRPPINRPTGSLLRNIVEVPLVDDNKYETKESNNTKVDAEKQKGIIEKRVARFGVITSNQSGESEKMDLRSRLGSNRPHQSLPNRGNEYQNFGNNRGGYSSHRSREFNHDTSSEGNCSLGVTHIPPGMNTIGHLNSHFSQFGDVTNIQISFGNDPRNALVTFKTAASAMKAYRSPEPILSNRFIRTYLPKSDVSFARGRGRGQPSYRGGVGSRLPVKRRLGTSATTTETNPDDTGTSSHAKRRLHHRLGRNFDESSSESDDEDWGVPDDNPPPCRRRVTLDNNGSGEFSEDSSMREAMEEMKRKEELAERKEAAAQMRAEQLQTLERMRKRKELRVQQIQLYNKMKEQLKLLNKTLENYEINTPKRTALEKTIKIVESQLSELEKQLGVDLEGPTSIQNVQRKILDLEIEQHNREQSSQDTSEVKLKLSECRRRLAMFKRRVEAQNSMFPSRGQTKLDKRPRTLLIQAQQEDVNAKLLLTHIAWYGAQIEKYEYQSNDKVLHVTFRSRMDAEFVSSRFHEYKGKPLRIEWGKTIERSASTSSDREVSGGTSENKIADSGGDTNASSMNELESHENDSSGDISNSEQQKKNITLGSEGFVSYEDEEFDNMMTALDDSYDPNCDPEFSSRSPIVVRAESGSSSGEDETEDENEDDNIIEGCDNL